MSNSPRPLSNETEESNMCAMFTTVEVLKVRGRSKVVAAENMYAIDVVLLVSKCDTS